MKIKDAKMHSENNLVHMHYFQAVTRLEPQSLNGLQEPFFIHILYSNVDHVYGP